MELSPRVGSQKLQPFLSLKQLQIPYWDESASYLKTTEKWFVGYYRCGAKHTNNSDFLAEAISLPVW